MGKNNSMIAVRLSNIIRIRSYIRYAMSVGINIYVVILNFINNLLAGFVVFFGIIILINLQSIISTGGFHVLDLIDLGSGLIGAYLRAVWLLLDSDKDDATYSE